MLAILATTFPFFALILLGFLATRRGLLPEASIPGLNTYVLWFALPCMLFGFGRQLPLSELFNGPILLTYAIAAALLFFVTVNLSYGRVNLKDASFGALVAVFPNSGFIGVPLLVSLMGPSAAGPVIITMVFDMLIMTSLMLALAQLESAPPGSSSVQTFLRAMRGALSNPMPWAIVAGAAVGHFAWSMPAPAERVIHMLGVSASPVALFTIGAVLARARRAAIESGQGTPLADFGPVVAIKLLAHPSLVFLSGWALQKLGVPLSPEALIALVLVSALPSASNVSLLAERYQADNGRVARIILWSTVLAFASFSTLAWVLL